MRKPKRRVIIRESLDDFSWPWTFACMCRALMDVTDGRWG